MLQIVGKEDGARDERRKSGLWRALSMPAIAHRVSEELAHTVFIVAGII